LALWAFQEGSFASRQSFGLSTSTSSAVFRVRPVSFLQTDFALIRAKSAGDVADFPEIERE
jgi:hypothetical protein